MTLDEPDTRIRIMGPPDSGKSTLAEAIAQAKGLVAHDPQGRERGRRDRLAWAFKPLENKNYRN